MPKYCIHQRITKNDNKIMIRFERTYYLLLLRGEKKISIHGVIRTPLPPQVASN